jgi:two-component system CheB/CheR fusion protein
MAESGSGATEPQSKSDFLIAGIGGSAGSIPAFQTFFRNVQPDSGVAYVVVLHLSPEYESRLAEVLQNTTSVPVTQVHQAVRVVPDHVYVIPPNHSLAMQDGMLVPSQVTSFEERRAPIDIFFRTLADTHDSRAVSVILSGSGSDGSMGLRRVKERNGLVVVQDPTEAEFEEMPRNSIATGLVDFVLPAAMMPGKILAYRDQIRSTPVPFEDASEGDEQALTEIFTLLRVRTGHDFTNYKRATTMRRLQRRLVIRELKRLSDYAQVLRDDPSEPEALLRELLISVTHFFRDAAVWNKIEHAIIPALLRGKTANDHVRVWFRDAPPEKRRIRLRCCSPMPRRNCRRRRKSRSSPPTSTKMPWRRRAPVFTRRRRSRMCRRSASDAISTRTKTSTWCGGSCARACCSRITI